ncbi:hypothetical protein N7462_000107 [Penicillium macrosclerotiorum]|uniref:uncharacterized protein n=1 Tax=Penicillium macrosclerotiorum TaxID=303699 RepID=UPI002547F51D|nr:uncharacterized protein N7462_000107 [Penicillium macrosclerotiorum]KAJ5698102.1 hypothetical protein N7462_000107 [Penicillium macrosclerotiorum]
MTLRGFFGVQPDIALGCWRLARPKRSREEQRTGQAGKRGPASSRQVQRSPLAQRFDSSRLYLVGRRMPPPRVQNKVCFPPRIKTDRCPNEHDLGTGWSGRKARFERVGLGKPGTEGGKNKRVGMDPDMFQAEKGVVGDWGVGMLDDLAKTLMLSPFSYFFGGRLSSSYSVVGASRFEI